MLTILQARKRGWMPQDIVTPVTRNIDLGHGNFLLEFEAPDMLREMRPAQFFMIEVPGADMLLRRPFSVCGLAGTFDDGPDGAAQVLYKVLGRGTGLMATLRPGAPLAVLGPLGRGFSLPAPGGADPRPVFVAGGIGSAPFPALAAALAERGLRPIMFYGGRTEYDLPLLDWFREHCAEVVTTTEDGSLGLQGLITQPLEELLAGDDPHPPFLYACGPEPMLKAVARLALRHDVPCEMSLEAPMACGFGVCLGCVVPTDQGYERVCVDGPVMRAQRLAW